MKQLINIIIFFTILAIPFALSSQTRKAIPAGRYESLSGIKNSRSLKNLEIASGDKKDATGLFWSEVLRHVPDDSKRPTYFSNGKVDQSYADILTNRGFKEVRELTKKPNIIISDDLKRDQDVFKELKSKSVLVVLKETQALKDVLSSLNRFDVLLYQVEKNSHYFLLQLK